MRGVGGGQAEKRGPRTDGPRRAPDRMGAHLTTISLSRDRRDSSWHSALGSETDRPLLAVGSPSLLRHMCQASVFIWVTSLRTACAASLAGSEEPAMRMAPATRGTVLTGLAGRRLKADAHSEERCYRQALKARNCAPSRVKSSPLHEGPCLRLQILG
ncbi:hypothetical protein SKAU_G00348150 [Synaphobranchus kaupii]|uniref:Uncharacterized protein n=1 Tax=Synaphobranchus kaupii TaxID=118154 RepID=A0A9Q1EJY2_SYNKA|nr:hypothetical protein SKAU_G00348150 [Synaphobranchus kaupii]